LLCCIKLSCDSRLKFKAEHNFSGLNQADSATTHS
jgi:hypothetical protein